MQEDSRWKTSTYIIGGILGLLTGIAASYLFIRARGEWSEDDRKLTSGQGVKIGLGVVSFLRQISDNISR